MPFDITPQTRRVLLNTAETFDAGYLGYDGSADPQEDGQGLKLACENGWYILNGPDGELVLHDRAARHLAQMVLEDMAVNAHPNERAALSAWIAKRLEVQGRHFEIVGVGQ
jgi:hypothetical protein